MRIRVIIDGVYQWGENTPATPNPPKGFSGGLVVSASRPAKGAGLTANQASLDARPVRPGRPRKPVTDEQVAARRKAWRESEARKRAEQRDYRSKIRAEIAAAREQAA